MFHRSLIASHYPVIKIFHCLLIVLKIPMFSMPSSHDLVIFQNVLLPFHCFTLDTKNILNISNKKMLNTSFDGLAPYNF
jgi:hypothetical protein